MKKMVSFLTALTLMAGFTACGDKDSGEKKEKSDGIEGSWGMESDDTAVTMVFDDGKISAAVVVPDLLEFDGDKVLFGGEELSEDDYEFDGKKFSCSMQGQSILEMEKTGGGEDNYDGEYNITGGVFSSILSSALGAEETDADMSLVVAGDTTTFVLNDIADYEAKDGKLTISGVISFISDAADGEDEATVEYKINGDTLTLTNEDGEETELTRK